MNVIHPTHLTEPQGIIIVDPKNKWTLSAPGRFGFLTEPAQDVLLILNFTIKNRKES